MNFIRKMSGGVRGDVREDSGPTSPDNNLGLMHLRKLFGDFRQPPPGTSQRELEGKLYTMLPLFCKVNCSIFNICTVSSSSMIYCQKYHL